ncbi:MAG TPA: heterocyst frequency control protein PatD [Coleofasciculaceae cyanobacterium]
MEQCFYILPDRNKWGWLAMSEQPTNWADVQANGAIAPDAAPYAALGLALETMRSTLDGDGDSDAAIQTDLEAVRQAVAQLPEGVGLEQSLQVEIHKQLRLLEMDRAFLRTARQAVTVAQRRSAMRDRIGVLLGYCTAGVAMRDASKPQDRQD